MGSFTVHADFNALDGGATLTTQVTIRSNTQVIASGGVIYDAAAHPLEAGVLQVELPANDNDPFDFGYTITRANGLTKVWRIPAQNPGVTVELTTFTATTPLPLPPSGNAVSQTDYAAYTTSNDAAVAANATAIGNEVTRATAAEATKVNSSTYTSGQATQDAALTAETTRATAAEGANATAITGEATTARAAELALRNLSDSTFASNLSASMGPGGTAGNIGTTQGDARYAVLMTTLSKTADYTAGAQEFVEADATSAVVTIIGPAAGAAKRWGVKKVNGVSNSPGNKVTISYLNASGVATALDLTLAGESKVFRPSGSGYRVEAGDTPRAALDVAYSAKSAVERFAQVYRHPAFLAGTLSLTPPTTATAVYCDPVAGNDSLAGTSQATAKLTLGSAVVKAYTLADVSVVYLKSTPSDRTTWARVQLAVNLAAGKIVYIVPWPGLTSWWAAASTVYAAGAGGWTADGGGVYHRAHTAPAGCDVVVAADVLDGNGFETKLAKNASTPTTPPAGQFGYTGGNLYLRLADSSDPNTHTIEASINAYVVRSCGSGLLILNNGNLRYGGSQGGLAGGNTGTPGGNLIAVDTTAHYTGTASNGGAWALGNTGDTILLVRSPGRRAANDGLNVVQGPVDGTLSALTGRPPTAVAIDTEFDHNDDEGTSDHQHAEIYHFGCNLHDNAGGDFNGVHDSYTEFWGTKVAGTIGFLDRAAGRVIGGTRGALSNTGTGSVTVTADPTGADVSSLIMRSEVISKAIAQTVAGLTTVPVVSSTPTPGAFSLALQTGSWITSPHGTRTSGAPTLNRVYYLPIWMPSTGGTLRGLACNQFTPIALGAGRLAFYLGDALGGLPGTVLAQGAVDLSTGSATTDLAKTVTGLATLLGGGIHWLSFVAQGASATLRTISFGLGLIPSPPGGTNPAGGSSAIALFTDGVTGALGSNPTITGATTSSTVPVLFAQIDPAA